MADGELILATGALLAGALVASLLAGRLRVPGLLLFLGLGMLIGSDGTGWIKFDDYELARTIGIIGLALILFEGGLTAGFQEIRPVLASAISLATLGTVLTAVIGGLAAAWLFDLSTLEGLLLGAILAATDGAAIFAVLRESTLRRKLARTLEGEAGMNDPVAILLVIGFIDWIQDPEYGIGDMLFSLVGELLIGAAVGIGVGWGAIYGLRRTRLASAGLYPVASISIAAVAYGLADVAHGSGFLAVYLAGLVLGSADQIPAKRTITTFHAGLGWLAQVAMFLTLGLLVFPSELIDVAVEGTALGLVIAVVARPIATVIATSPFGYSLREQAVLGWAGLRGALPVVFATFPVIEGVPNSQEFFNIVFFAVVVSTLLQGATFEALARWLGVTDTEAALPLPLADAGAMRRLGAEVIEYPVGNEHAIVGFHVRELGLPRDALLNLLIRGNQALLPRGSTRIESGDRLHLIVRQEAAVELRELMSRWRSGPVGVRRRPVRKHLTRQTPFVLRPWGHPGDQGDPSRPEAVHGVDVIDQIRTRRDGRPGAVVLLEDGRYAFTGTVVALGTPSQVQMAARRRLRLAKTDSERAWWREAIGALAAPER
ncbi:MAG TPA: potassium/proton antiporter [Thermoleophilaceae bacterium]|nr:potassium/proton antiporter [Thermoleophilaceae bacterium]